MCKATKKASVLYFVPYTLISLYYSFNSCFTATSKKVHDGEIQGYLKSQMTQISLLTLVEFIFSQQFITFIILCALSK